MLCVVTGANGFVGSNLCKALIKKGHKVRGLVRVTSDLSSIEKLNIELINGSLDDKESLKKAVANVDIVYHVAALANDWGSLKLYRRINVEGTKNILEASSVAKVKRFVYISSIAVHSCYGRQDADENAPAEAVISSYCISKRESESLVMDFYKKTGFPVTIVRPGDVFGPNDRTSFLRMAVPLKKGTLPYIDHGRTVLAYTYVENLVDGIMLAGENKNSIGQAYIITDGIKVTWKELYDALVSELGFRKPLFSLNSRFAWLIAVVLETIYGTLGIKTRPIATRYLINHLRYDFHFSIEKAKKELGYKPEIPFNEGIKRIAQWYKEYLKTVVGR